MADPHPKNAQGPFYVEYGCCTACEVPTQEAPANFAFDADDHCYVCRQPQSDAETTSLVSAAWMAEFQCIRYRGSDGDLLRRMAELDLRHLCDIQPAEHISPVIRNHITLAIADRPTPSQLAFEFIDHLNRQNEQRPEHQTEFKTTSIVRLADSAYFDLSWYDDHFHRVTFHTVDDDGNTLHVNYPITNDLGDRGVGNVLLCWLDSNLDRYKNQRWYADHDWPTRKHHQPMPW
ncbi:ferredoxin [Mariniblastus sp.]|nr:ferredoxin [Mariniblastus sp.]